VPRPLPAPDRATIPEEELEAYDAALARAASMRADQPGAGLPPYFAVLLNTPPLAAGLMTMGRLVRTRGEAEGSYSHHDREFVDQVLSALWKTNVVQALHIPDALATGVRIEAIDALRAGRDEELTEDELLLATYIRAVATGTVTDALYASMEERLGQRGTVEYTLFITFLMQTMRNFQALGMDDPGEAEIDALLDAFRDGRQTVPDFRVRIR
jgi:plasmid stabilization system protein ParE